MKRKNNFLINNSLLSKKIFFEDLNNNEFYQVKLKAFEKIDIFKYMRENHIKYLNIGFTNKYNKTIITNTFVLDGYVVEEEKDNLFNYNNLNYKPLFNK